MSVEVKKIGYILPELNDVITDLKNNKTYYLKVYNEPGITDIKIRVYYDLGGINYFSHAINRRGYYISLTPVNRVNNGSYTSESFAMFSGVKYFLNNTELKRDSAKAKNEALNNVNFNLLKDLLNDIK